MIATGFSVAGASAFFEQFRSLFLSVAIVLLGIGFYLNYRPQRTDCGPDGNCATPTDRLRPLNRGILWISVVLVAALAFFPSYVGRVFGAPSTSTANVRSNMVLLSIEGMTCTGCEAAVVAALAELPEVLHAEANYDDGQATVQLADGVAPNRLALSAAVGKAGYALTAVDEVEKEQALPLAGHWITEVENHDGEEVELIMDLGVLNSRWVGEFDLPKYGIENFPVEVGQDEGAIHLYLTAIGMKFEGTLSADSQSLQGQGHANDEVEDIVFRRAADAEFSDGFLELESAADDPSLVESLSADGSELRERFNADVDKTRLLMLLAPT
jgi:copper chaperone CopZ